MPRAEAGSTKAISNQLKSKGLQRLRWYCQVCEKQCRDDNGFKCHVASESHVRNMMVVGQNSKKFISDYSMGFQRDFVQLLRTGHGEKKINANHFYNEYISNKEHVHLNATRWNSLTEFVKHLGREGIIRVHEDEKAQETNQKGAAALMISWIDNSPEAMRRQNAIKKREQQDKSDEYREHKQIEAQIRKARAQAGEKDLDDEGLSDVEEAPLNGGIKNTDREKISLSFGTKKTEEPQKPPSPPLTDKSSSPPADSSVESSENILEPQEAKVEQPAKVSIKPLAFGGLPKPKNVFKAASTRNAFSTAKRTPGIQQQRPMSEAERIMKEEIERKRQREANGGNAFKRQRIT